MTQTILVLDFGSQYTQVIARRIRENNVYSKVIAYDTSIEEIKAINPVGIILSGGPASVLVKGAPLPDSGIFDLGVPILGICYGVQLMGHLLGGKVSLSEEREYGHGNIEVQHDSLIFKNTPNTFSVWNSHGDKLVKLPKGFKAIAETENSKYAGIQNEKRKFYGLQFHPEVEHSEFGKEIIQNFLCKICGCSGDWSMSAFIDRSLEQIREEVAGRTVLLGLSGGVDSSVAAALIHRAIGDRLVCVFVDNGLLRLNERAQVENLFDGDFKVNLRVAKSAKLFLSKLKGITDPEKKRKIIGKTFIDVFDKEVEKIGKVDFLAQGTLYPDIIESLPIGGNPASLIKSHHNVGGLPKKMKLKLLEPLKELFKDEVRKVGEELGLSKELVWRQPFPGPGLAVRIMGEITVKKLDILRAADDILNQEMVASDYYYKVWQSFCVFLPVQTVGVMGDERTYDYVIAVRIVESSDAMTADWAQVPYEILRKVSSRIINEVKGINRVVYDISSKPPSTIEWE